MRTLTFTIDRLREMLLAHAYSSVPVRVEAKRAEIDEGLDHEWYRQQARPEQHELASALRVISRFHTKDDMEAGFTVHTVAPGEHPLGPYIKAWAVIRKAIGQPSEPKP